MKMNLSVIPAASTSTIKELLLRAESLLGTLGHYLSLYHALCWLIKLPDVLLTPIEKRWTGLDPCANSHSEWLKRLPPISYRASCALSL
jgi:hypothetical protein